MLNIKITVSDINWESCTDAVFPIAYEKIRNSDKQSLVIEILKKSGADLPRLLKKVLTMVSDAEKIELIQWAVGAFERKILSAINGILVKKKLSDCVSVSGIRAASCALPGELELQLSGVYIDYGDPAIREILRDRLSVTIPTAFTGFIGRTAQTAIIKITGNKTFSRKLCALAESKLRGKGIAVRITECEIVNSSETDIPTGLKNNDHPMPDMLKKCIVRVAGELIGQLGS